MNRVQAAALATLLPALASCERARRPDELFAMRNSFASTNSLETQLADPQLRGNELANLLSLGTSSQPLTQAFAEVAVASDKLAGADNKVGSREWVEYMQSRNYLIGILMADPKADQPKNRNALSAAVIGIPALRGNIPYREHLDDKCFHEYSDFLPVDRTWTNSPASVK